jgi:DNA-binding LytR/AlgR family response regulator
VTETPPGLDVLVVDDELPVLDELAFLLGRDPRIASVVTAASGADALRVLQERAVDAVFLDVAMPGLSGLDVAGLLARFRRRPPVVFVTAHDDHAVEAFDLEAVDYVLKPVDAARLREAVRRVVAGIAGAQTEEAAAVEDQTIPVELAGVTRFVARSDIRYVEAQGDYARLHTDTESHLVRVPLSTLEERWADAGFLRIHRSLLVNSRHVREVRSDAGRASVVVDGPDGPVELQVARRHTRDLRDQLVRRGV